MGNRGCILNFANIWCVCMSIAIDMFIALLGITWSLSCGIWLCMHMLYFGFYCVSFLSLTSPVNIWCMDCFKIVPWELLQLPNGFTRLKLIENQWNGARFYVWFLVNVEGEDKVLKKRKTQHAPFSMRVVWKVIWNTATFSWETPRIF